MRILHWCGSGVRVWIYKPVQDDTEARAEGGGVGEMGLWGSFTGAGPACGCWHLNPFRMTQRRVQKVEGSERWGYGDPSLERVRRAGVDLQTRSG
jgi:hypothetical protein